MIEKLRKRLAFVLSAVLLIGAGLTLGQPTATANNRALAPIEGGGGEWGDVCCGPSCTYDYCRFDGDYSCCK